MQCIFFSFKDSNLRGGQQISKGSQGLKKKKIFPEFTKSVYLAVAT